MEKTFTSLLSRMQELKDLNGIIGLATWDQETYLPPKADAARASQLSTLQGLYHERLVDPRLGEALAWAAARSDLEPDQRAMVRVLTQERDRAVKLPQRLVKELAETQGHALTAWRQARKEQRFAIFQPALERLLALRREQADAYGHDGERYDALLETYEPGMRVARLTPVLASLREALIPRVAAIKGSTRRIPNPFGGRRFDPEAQWRFTLEVLRDMGFDLEAGRQDKSIHPFTGGTHPNDVRVTTRIFEDNPLSAVFSTIHEGGHGLYEQGFSPGHHRTPLAAAPSMGIHESQSRLWENVVGRSRAFWEHYLPGMRAHFPELAGVGLEDFYAAVNHVTPSFIRVEADEVTYNLHIVLRYELELLLIRDAIPLSELPAAWNERMRRFLGITPPDDTQGVLQDIHWAWGDLGYFPTYTLGNLYAASLYRAAERAIPDLTGHIRRGELLPLRDWLRINIHHQGYRLPAEELIRQVTGKGLTDADFLTYLDGKYSELYGVSF